MTLRRRRRRGEVAIEEAVYLSERHDLESALVYLIRSH